MARTWFHGTGFSHTGGGAWGHVQILVQAGHVLWARCRFFGAVALVGQFSGVSHCLGSPVLAQTSPQAKISLKLYPKVSSGLGGDYTPCRSWKLDEWEAGGEAYHIRLSSSRQNNLVATQIRSSVRFRPGFCDSLQAQNLHCLILAKPPIKPALQRME
jgi:hypothetical protein